MLHANTTMSYQNSYVKNQTLRPVSIAPAFDENYSAMDLDLNQEKKYVYKNLPNSGAQTASIARRNARERNRVKQVNDGFNVLRKKLPAAVISALSGGSRRGSGKKLSKVDTLKMVVEYIRYLENMLDESDASLNLQQQTITEIDNHENDEGVFGSTSPYLESVPSPVSSECSSGVSSSYSACNDYYNYNSATVSNIISQGDFLNNVSWC